MTVKKGVCLSAVLLVLLVVVSFYVVGDTVVGSFTTLNAPPTVSSGFQIQDRGPPAADNWDTTATFDTHDITPHIQWTEGVDPNNDPVSTHVCISDDTSANDAFELDPSVNGGCDYYFKYDDPEILDGDVILTFSGLTTKTYWISLTPDDGQASNNIGPFIRVQVDFINHLPTISSLDAPGATTHDPEPTLTWTAGDPDDGNSVDYWPADSVTYDVSVGTGTAGDTTYMGVIGWSSGTTILDTDNQWTIPIPWGTPSGYLATTVAQVRIVAKDNHNALSSNFDTSFSLVDNLPSITSVELVNGIGAFPGSGDCFTSGYASGYCIINPIHTLTETLASVKAEVVVNEPDDDCTTGTHNVQIDFCTVSAGPACTSGITYQLTLDSLSTSGSGPQQCTFTLSAAADMMPFFLLPATGPTNAYRLYVKAESQAGESTTATNADGKWEYNLLSDVDYPSDVLLGAGANVQLGVWSDGANMYQMTNWGNDVLDLNWEASNPTGISLPNDEWILTGTDFAIDDDGTREGPGDDINPLDEVYLRNFPSANPFQPAGGLGLCTIIDCSAGTNHKLDTYFHIFPRLGLAPGTYESTITLTLY